MELKQIAVEDIDVSEFNTRKDLADGQQDSSIEDLAKSIEKQGLLNPISVFQNPDGRYTVVAGQRRLLAHRWLGRDTISAVVREKMTEGDATAMSLVENVHRADMNPRDKAVAFKALLDRLGDLGSVSRETGVGGATIRKYVQLLNLNPELQERLAAGEVKNTQALAFLAQRVPDSAEQSEVWDRIEGFTQDVQQKIIKNTDADLSNLDTLVDQAAEGAFDYRMVRNCPFDCPTVPTPLKGAVDNMIREFQTQRT